MNTVTRDAENDTEVNHISWISEVSPRVEPMIAVGIRTKAGCRREEKSVLPNLANDVTDKTNSRSIRAPLKPKKKNLIQKCGASKMADINTPKSSIPNHIREEKKDRAEIRLKLKIRSRLIVVMLTMKSEKRVNRKKLPPKLNPITKCSGDKFKARIERIPPCNVRILR